MIDFLVENYPRWVARDELGEGAGVDVAGGSFGTYLSNLRASGLVDVNGGQVRASEELVT